ncbi:MAG: hypothetical protein IPK64_13110 [bacterium]|nr:hypothetical protein [bacterium]
MRRAHLQAARRWAAAAVAVLVLGGTADEARADFRFLGMGARPRAMGSAFVSLADDANAAFWNPAGLVRSHRSALMLTRAWLYDTDELRHDYLAVEAPTWRNWHVGASWVRLSIPDLYNEDQINLAVAHELPFVPGLSVGITGKLFLLSAPGYERYNDPYYNGGDHGFSADLGLLYDSGGAWTVGAAFYNLKGTELQLLENTSDPDPVPSDWAAGGSWLFRETLLVTADVRSRDGQAGNLVVHGGAEIWFFDALVLRSGLDRGLVTMGAGLQDKHWQADFAVQTDRRLGNVYLLSFTVRK